MLLGPMTHPELIAVLGAAGHGAKILIIDGNYPASTGGNPAADRIYLNLAPGLLDVDQVLSVIKKTIPIEAAGIMVPAPGGPPLDPAVHAGYKAALPDIPFEEMDRFAFYDAARSEDLAVIIATGDQRLYANILLTIGVRTA
ncbi:MAG: RbsD/FucU family protein [Actinomycetaceae bacterium]|nr:RbsD/FucU family protein [Actinomycetaceae bacterium]